MAELFSVTREIKGEKYTAQFNGVYASEMAQENCVIAGTNAISNVEYGKYLLENVLVKPKLTFDDFSKNKGKTETRVIDGEEYTATNKGIETSLRALDSSYTTGDRLSMLKLSQFVLDNIITKPEKLKVDDFKNKKIKDEVVAFGISVMNGEERELYDEIIMFAKAVSEGDFREEADKGTAKTKGAE